ncbi:MAG: hypothetical protein WKF88_02095 [Ferruginibacter sp.]
MTFKIFTIPFLLVSICLFAFQEKHTIVHSLNKVENDSLIDYAINDIGLNEYSNIKKHIGKPALNQLKKSAKEGKEIWIQTQIISKDFGKYFRLVLQEGSACCQYFEVGYNSKQIKGKKFTSFYKDFISDNSIRLGIDTTNFRNNLTNSNLVRNVENDTTTYNYLVEEPINSGEKKYYKYVSEYVFVKNRLVRFGFGTIPTFPRYDLRVNGKIYKSTSGNHLLEITKREPRMEKLIRHLIYLFLNNKFYE